MSDIGKRIRIRRNELGLTLLEVADKLGVKEATIQRYESGAIKNIKHKTLCELAEILHCAPAYIMGWVTDTPNNDNEIDEEDLRLLAAYHRASEEVQSIVKSALSRYMDDFSTDKSNAC